MPILSLHDGPGSLSVKWQDKIETPRRGARRGFHGERSWMADHGLWIEEEAAQFKFVWEIVESLHIRVHSRFEIFL
jgi:hypothetical protein